MNFIKWIIKDFGLFFGPIFLIFVFLIIKRFTLLYDVLRHVPSNSELTTLSVVDMTNATSFLDPFYDCLKEGTHSDIGINAILEALWLEFDRQVSDHFTTLHTYINALILFGFAGTIAGSIAAFGSMFQGFAAGQQASDVFAAAWTGGGLGTALYTSLGSSLIAAIVIMTLVARVFMNKTRNLEIIVNLRIIRSVEQQKPNVEENNDEKKTTKIASVGDDTRPGGGPICLSLCDDDGLLIHVDDDHAEKSNR